MPSVKKSIKLTPEEYLAGESSSEVKHELVDGHAYAMAGASANHERISGNIYSEFRNHLKASPCEPFGSDMKVRGRDNFYYPDVLVDCNFDESEPYFTKTPVIIVEVISKSTRKTDEQTKRIEYIHIPTLQEYVIIEQDYPNPYLEFLTHPKSICWFKKLPFGKKTLRLYVILFSFSFA